MNARFIAFEFEWLKVDISLFDWCRYMHDNLNDDRIKLKVYVFNRENYMKKGKRRQSVVLESRI